MNQSKEKHTATPWKQLKKSFFGIYKNRNVTIGHAYTDGDAEFVVKACNSHDALVDALKNTLQTLKDDRDDAIEANGEDCNNHWKLEIAEIESALKMAGE